ITWQPCFTEKDCFGETPKPTRETGTLLFFRNLPAPPQNLRFCPGCFSLLDFAIAIVEKRQAGPANLIVRPQFGGAFSRFNCFRKSSDFHQRHSEGVPAVKKFRIDLHAPPILLDRALQFSSRKITIRVVEDFVARCHVQISSGLSAGPRQPVGVPAATRRKSSRVSPARCAPQAKPDWPRPGLHPADRAFPQPQPAPHPKSESALSLHWSANRRPRS